MRATPMNGLDDAMIALYQNGERLMPANGYPMRLLLPGYEGNMNVKYLRRIKLVAEPAMSYWEAKIYTPILPNGKAYQFYLLQEVKSFINQPSPEVEFEGTGAL
jgi:sulfane dehydrogenase subunit SoxC